MSKVSKKAAAKPGTVKVKVTAVLETTFASYGNAEYNHSAIKQIQCFVEEVLQDEAAIPLFIASQAGEETGPVKVTVKAEKIPDKRRSHD